jgi:hypothetical protein
MARVCTVLCASHSPWLFYDASLWEAGRAARFARGGLSPATPIDSPEENAAKYQRIRTAYATLRAQLEAAKPDVLLIFGDDQLEQFNFRNFPAFALFTGESYGGYKISRYEGLPVGAPRAIRDKSPEHWATVNAQPAFARALMRELMIDGFDMAFSNGLVDEEEGMGHAFMRPSSYLDPEYRLPTVPLFVNCYYGPQPTAKRCYELGRAVRGAIERIPLDLNVAVLASGGLWHLPNVPNSWLDEDFDRRIIAGITGGDARATAAYFDSVVPPYDPSDPASVDRASGGTGIVLGWGGGTGETRTWIAASAVVDGLPGRMVDYIPVYASPIGVGFAYWEQV